MNIAGTMVEAMPRMVTDWAAHRWTLRRKTEKTDRPSACTCSWATASAYVVPIMAALPPAFSCVQIRIRVRRTQTARARLRCFRASHPAKTTAASPYVPIMSP